VYDNPLAFFRQCARWQDWGGADSTGQSGAKRKEAKKHTVAG